LYLHGDDNLCGQCEDKRAEKEIMKKRILTANLIGKLKRRICPVGQGSLDPARIGMRALPGAIFYF